MSVLSTAQLMVYSTITTTGIVTAGTCTGSGRGLRSSQAGRSRDWCGGTARQVAAAVTLAIQRVMFRDCGEQKGTTESHSTDNKSQRDRRRAIRKINTILQQSTALTVHRTPKIHQLVASLHTAQLATKAARLYTVDTTHIHTT